MLYAQVRAYTLPDARSGLSEEVFVLQAVDLKSGASSLLGPFHQNLGVALLPR